MILRYLLFVLVMIICSSSSAQDTYPINGPKPSKKNIFALKNVTLATEPGKEIKNATVLICENKIVDAGNNVIIPDQAIVKDLTGLYIYPAFIDLYSGYGLTVEAKNKDPKRAPKSGASNWNEAIKPELDGTTLFKTNTKEAEEYRNNGFAMVLTHQKDGIMRGTSTLVNLNDGNENEVIYKNKVSQNLSFEKGNSRTDYPNSLMGTIALLRQTYYDANWYLNQNKEFNPSLAAINSYRSIPSVFEVNSVFQAIRADKIGDEFGINYIIKSSGDDYKRLDELKKTNLRLILPLNFPAVPDVNDFSQLREINLAELKHWEMAPFNSLMLYKNQIPFVLTASDLKDKSLFLKNLRKAIKLGLPEIEALKALTTEPAKWINEEKNLGQLKKDYIANFIVCTKPLFDEENIILENWICGKRYEINKTADTTLAGNYLLKLNGKTYSVELRGNQSLKGSIKEDTLKFDLNIVIKNNTVDFNYFLKDKNPVLASGIVISKIPLIMKGSAKTKEGVYPFEIVYDKPLKKNDKKEETKDTSSSQELIPSMLYPFTAFGFKELPKQEIILIKNATIWTNTSKGNIIGDLLINNGKIENVSEKIIPPINARVVDASGKHLTNGIIDEHSHIAITGGVNESGQENTAEVRVGDVLNSEDINIYRQLAGGVTSAQLLHGSANPVGGQSALIKLRWGQSQDNLKISGADEFIKFALGENPKQSNWGNANRYPHSRMGVEQVYMDAFFKARDYENKIKTAPKGTRKDLEAEAMLEILNSKRFISCHSYIQSEINMLMHVADSFKFKVNTFTHILEGYKVADKMKAHGVYASTFADWWAYKFEVNDAIPFNAALLTRVGVVTGINSDDAEMARRLNQEAAKVLKYGGLSETEAWKMITLNPAKMLHLDKQLGTIEKGKDADLVIWTDNPLSVYAKVDKTFVDGVCLFDTDRNKQLTEDIQAEKNRLYNKIIEAKKGG
jgi:imidazolonepropionase-like amidohydrolase